jgi:hypothetical protein
VAIVGAVLFSTAAGAQVVSMLPGGTWSVLADSTAGGAAAIVSGPATPPAGTGSLRLSVASMSDIILVGTDLGAVTARPWAGLSASFSTYVAAGGVAPFAPTLRFAGFQTISPTPTNFTTLSVEPSRQGTVTPGQWQAWTLGPTSTVWQTNTSDGGFCIQSAPCTFAEFLARYPNGAWGQAQLGIGSGAPAGATGFVDAVTITDGTTSLFTDFDPPAASPSASPSPSLAPSSSAAQMLPVTGSHELPQVALTGAAAALLGTALILIAARRHRRHGGHPHPGGR